MYVAVGHFCAHRLLVLATWSPPSVTLLVLLERVFPRLHFLSRNLKRDTKGLGEVPCVPRQTAHFTSFPHRTMRLLVSVCYLSMGIPCSACLQLVFKASSRDTCQFSNLDSENLVAEAEEPANLGPWRIHVAWRRASMGLPSRTGTLATVPSQDGPRISRSQAATCVPPPSPGLSGEGPRTSCHSPRSSCILTRPVSKQEPIPVFATP